ncbi:MAG TPA: hypothetical protein VF173_19090 [Thermoanaerobaculia bacterium]|nr:hypothetical protein [Thermoanaerobaculia bacterium]
MKTRPTSAVVLCILVASTLLGQAQAEPTKTEIQGTAILEHPCGKVSVKHMGLVHAGKFDEASKLGTKEMQEQWKALPAKDREMMTGMMKEMSKTEEQLAAEIKVGGLLVVEGNQATLTIKQEHKDANGSNTETMTQRFVIDGTKCWITR